MLVSGRVVVVVLNVLAWNITIKPINSPPIWGMIFWDVFPSNHHFHIRKSKASKDLSSCACLSRILALYPYEPLPAILCHAPVVCKYPPH